MINGKIRSESHLIDQEAVLTIRNKLPKEWIVRELSPDYGIDLDVELFIKENGKILTLGEHLFLQVKGTKSAKYREVSVGSEEYQTTRKCLIFSLDTALLRLVERVGASLPILLVAVDADNNEAFFVCLNDYVEFVLYSDMKWREQTKKTIYIPCENRIECSTLLRWYALRPKLNAFFVQVAALRHELGYVSIAEEYIKKVSNFALSNEEADIWHCIDLGFGFMEPAFESMQYVIHSEICPSACALTQSFVGEEYITVNQFENISFNIAQQLCTAREFMERIDLASSMFYFDMRQLFLTTKFDALFRE